MNLRTLLPKKSSRVDPSRVLTDLPFLLRDVCGLKTDGKPAKSGMKRAPNAWADLRPNSAWKLAWDFLRKPLPPGKYGKLLLEPRGCGKSYKLRTFCTQLIIVDRDTIIQYISQNMGMASNRVTFIKNCLLRNERRFGEFKTHDNWGTEAFTVVRSGPSDEPTMLAGAPKKDVTGSHPHLFVWDDVVAPGTNKTRNARQDIIKTFEAALNQGGESARHIIIGTVYRGHTLYHEISKRYKKDFEILRIGAYGAAYGTNDEVVWGDENSEELNYPWFTQEYLERHRRTPSLAQSFRGQYMNQWNVSAEDAPFEPDMIVPGDPPLTAKGKLHPRLAVYMLTDLAETDKLTKNTSETAFIVIAKDTKRIVSENNEVRFETITYVIDVDIGRYNPTDRQERFFRMYYRWKDQGLLFATMEDRGPGKEAYHHLPLLAQARGQHIPAIVQIKRSSREEKDSRIGQLFVPLKAHMIRFSEKLIANPTMLRFDTRGEAQGIAVERLLGYSPLDDGLKDFPDALADAYATNAEGLVCPDPIPPQPEKEPLNDVEWARKRAMGELALPIRNMY
jgi:hypothetical protein